MTNNKQTIINSEKCNNEKQMQEPFKQMQHNEMQQIQKCKTNTEMQTNAKTQYKKYKSYRHYTTYKNYNN